MRSISRHPEAAAIRDNAGQVAHAMPWVLVWDGKDQLFAALSPATVQKLCAPWEEMEGKGV